MFKMSEAGHDHCHIVFIAIVHAFIVSYRTARVNYRSYAGFMGDFHAVWEWEESI